MNASAKVSSIKRHSLPQFLHELTRGNPNNRMDRPMHPHASGGEQVHQPHVQRKRVGRAGQGPVLHHVHELGLQGRFGGWVQIPRVGQGLERRSVARGFQERTEELEMQV